MAKRSIDEIQLGRFPRAASPYLDTLAPAWKVIADAFRRHTLPKDGIKYLASLTFVSEEVGEDRFERAGRNLVAEIREEIIRALPQWDRLGPVIRAWLKKRGIPEAFTDAKTAGAMAVHMFLLHVHPLLIIYSDPAAFFRRKDFDAFGDDFDEEREPERQMIRHARVLNRWGFAALVNDRIRAEFDQLLANDPASFLRMVAMAEERMIFTLGRRGGTKNKFTKIQREEISRIADAKKVSHKRLGAIREVLRGAGHKVRSGEEHAVCRKLAAKWKKPTPIDPDGLAMKSRPVAERAVWKIMGKLHPDANDAIQDAIMKVVQKPPRIRSAESIAAYVWKTAANVARDYLKKHAPRSEAELTESAVDRASIERFEEFEPPCGRPG
jgi:hypothetical protein